MKKRKPKTARRAGLSFQEVVFALSRFWAGQACVIQQPYDLEVGAGTMHPETFFRVLGPDPYRVAYVQPSRRPSDGRYGDNPNRLYKHIQFQVILKPAPAHVQEVYLASLEALGIDRRRHDIRFEEDNWEAPTLLAPVSVELTYGLERIAAFLQGVGNVFDLAWNDARRYGELRLEEERQASAYGFGWADERPVGGYSSCPS